MQIQRGRVRMDWGQQGAQASCQDAGLAVVVDVLSFTTTLTVAMDGGAEVYPFRSDDESAQEFARRHDAVLAVGRFEARDGAQSGAAVSLSPASIRSATGVARLVLPSPNGSALASELRARGVTVVGAALRNRLAVARWIFSSLAGNSGQPVSVIAAGERWPDDSLRPGVEDLWGAGAVISALADLGVGGLTAEARMAAAAFAAVSGSLPAELAASVSGQELIAAGFAADVAIAAELDTSDSVPVLSGERFVNRAAAG
jgi:2-phosphosulfolactate phosphatase